LISNSSLYGSIAEWGYSSPTAIPDLVGYEFGVLVFIPVEIGTGMGIAKLYGFGEDKIWPRPIAMPNTYNFSNIIFIIICRF
jgi:hypothetical protein